MNSNQKVARRLACLIAILILALFPASLLAGGSDYSDKDFSVRFAPAFVRFTEVSTLGGETVANRFSSASNPASAGWFSVPNKLGIIAAPYFSAIHFGDGTNLFLTGESLTWDTGAFGVFQPTLSQIRTNTVRDNAGMNFDYSTDTAQIQWAKRIENVAGGIDFNFAKAEMQQQGTFSQTTPFGPMPLGVDVNSYAESYRWRFGGLWQPVEKLLLGGIFEYGFQPFRNHTLSSLTIPGLGTSTTLTDENGIQQQIIFRPGVSYEYAKMSTVYADYQYGAYWNHRDQLIDHRFNVGVEHRIFDFWYVRAGPSFDNRGNIGLSVGTSVFPCEWCSIEAGYQYNMLPELQPEFGRANTVQVAVAFRF